MMRTFQPEYFGIHLVDNVVSSIEPGTQAERQGVQIGWRIEEINRKKCSNDKEIIEDEIYETVRKKKTNDSVIFKKSKY